ncbi:hypothetical protein D3C77_535940 [compost metagenome]
MSVSKETLYKMIAEIPQQEVEEVADFIGYLKMKRENRELVELSRAAESSLDFWQNDIDGEVWNNA